MSNLCVPYMPVLPQASQVLPQPLSPSQLDIIREFLAYRTIISNNPLTDHHRLSRHNITQHKRSHTPLSKSSRLLRYTTTAVACIRTSLLSPPVPDIFPAAPHLLGLLHRCLHTEGRRILNDSRVSHLCSI